MSQVAFSVMLEGSVSRFIRKSWLNDEPAITPDAFALRSNESFVSFYLVTGNCFESKIESAMEILGNGRLKISEGAIAILEIEACLDKVNDPDEDAVIEFKNASKGPNDTHCGLYYLVEDEETRYTAKTVLCFLARKKLHTLKKSEIKNQLSKK